MNASALAVGLNMGVGALDVKLSTEEGMFNAGLFK